MFSNEGSHYGEPKSAQAQDEYRFPIDKSNHGKLSGREDNSSFSELTPGVRSGLPRYVTKGQQEMLGRDGSELRHQLQDTVHVVVSTLWVTLHVSRRHAKRGKWSVYPGLRRLRREGLQRNRDEGGQ